VEAELAYWFNKRDLPKTPLVTYFINDIRRRPRLPCRGPILRTTVLLLPLRRVPAAESRSRTRYMMNPAAIRSLHVHRQQRTTQTVNLLASPSNGQTTTLDRPLPNCWGYPDGGRTTVAFAYDGMSISTTSSVGHSRTVVPTVRVDYNMTNAHRLTSPTVTTTSTRRPTSSTARPRFPVSPTWRQVSALYVAGHGRSTFGKSVINEFRYACRRHRKGTYLRRR